MADSTSETDPATAGLRALMLDTSPADIGIARSAELPDVWGLLMEMSISDTAVTLAVVADGTVSLYFRRGGGMLGLGAREPVRRAARAMLRAAQGCHGVMTAAADFPYPEAGRVCFYLLTFAGVVTADAEEQELQAGRGRLAGLYHAGQDVITEVRLSSEQEPD